MAGGIVNQPALADLARPARKVAVGNIADGSITTAKLANNAVDETKVKDAFIADFSEVVAATGDSFLLGDVGDSGNTKRDTIQRLIDLARIPDFTSTDQTVTADTVLDVAHSLSAKPRLVQVGLKCTTDNLGYVASTNDEVIFTDASTFSTDTGVTIFADATNVTIVQAAAIPLVDASSLNTASITVTSWRWVVRAWS